MGRYNILGTLFAQINSGYGSPGGCQEGLQLGAGTPLGGRRTPQGGNPRKPRAPVSRPASPRPDPARTRHSLPLPRATCPFRRGHRTWHCWAWGFRESGEGQAVPPGWAKQACSLSSSHNCKTEPGQAGGGPAVTAPQWYLGDTAWPPAGVVCVLPGRVLHPTVTSRPPPTLRPSISTTPSLHLSGPHIPPQDPLFTAPARPSPSRLLSNFQLIFSCRPSFIPASKRPFSPLHLQFLR